jgi:hypothetical protein
MGYLLANGALEFVWQNLLIGSAVYWSTATTAFILTRRPNVAFFTQVLMMILTYGLNNWFFILLVSGVYSWVLSRSTRNRILSAGALILPLIIAEATFDIYGTIAWAWEWTFSSVVSFAIGSALASPLSIVVGKMFKRC